MKALALALAGLLLFAPVASARGGSSGGGSFGSGGRSSVSRSSFKSGGYSPTYSRQPSVALATPKTEAPRVSATPAQRAAQQPRTPDGRFAPKAAPAPAPSKASPSEVVRRTETTHVVVVREPDSLFSPMNLFFHPLNGFWFPGNFWYCTFHICHKEERSW